MTSASAPVRARVFECEGHRAHARAGKDTGVDDWGIAHARLRVQEGQPRDQARCMVGWVPRPPVRMRPGGWAGRLIH